MATLTLVVGTQNYSSWSLRPWILMSHLDLPFTTRVIHFGTQEFATEVPKLSPTRRVPLLVDGEQRIWDSLAICEYASELAGGRGWPSGTAARAHARSVAAEMHSSFTALRSQCPMNIRARDRRVPMTAELAADVARIDALWSDCRRQHADAGPWLFGRYSVADAMFAPVAMRIVTYGLPIETLSRQYLQTVVDDPRLAPWIAAAHAENVVVPEDEAGAPST